MFVKLLQILNWKVLWKSGCCYCCVNKTQASTRMQTALGRDRKTSHVRYFARNEFLWFLRRDGKSWVKEAYIHTSWQGCPAGGQWVLGVQKGLICDSHTLAAPPITLNVTAPKVCILLLLLAAVSCPGAREWSSVEGEGDWGYMEEKVSVRERCL